jgi:predicted RNase H-like nuclease (RuvC/YqgF family)
MAEPVRKFMAGDAVAYVDTYRRLIMNTPGDITASRERLEARMHEMNMVPSRLYAELRAHEHAVNFVLKKQEPGMVTLGEAVEGSDGTTDLTARAEELRQLEDEVVDLRRNLRMAAQQQHELETELVVQSQEVGRLKRKLEQTYNSVAVGGVAVIVVLLVLFGIIAFRGG